MTRDQERCRELVAQIEGTNLTCHMSGPDLVVVSELGQTYRIDPEGEHIRVNNRTHHMTEADLEDEVHHPFFSAASPDDEPFNHPYDDELYEDLFPRETAKPLTDFHSDRDAELRAEEQRWRNDVEYYRRREAA